MNALRASLAPLAVIAIVWAAVSCGTVRGAYDACETAEDCVLPFVCCTKPRIPGYGQKIPFCERRDYCDELIPFLIEGNPCHRVAEAPDQECSKGLVCCPESLTCKPDGSCSGVVPAPPETPSNLACVADGECFEGEICCGISAYFRLDGKCAGLAACAPVVP